MLLDKSPSLDQPVCNSSLSTAGINGCCSVIQKAHKVEDSIESFVDDVFKAGSKKSDMIELLCRKSGESVDWLSSQFGLSFTLSRSGGQACARTHKTRDRQTGMLAVRALSSRALEIAGSMPDRLEIITGATASKLLTDAKHRVTGVEYGKDGYVFSISGPVVVCTGGFGADFSTNTSLIARYRPDIVQLSTAYVLESSTGDGIKLGEQVGAKLTDMMYVMVNPTGLVDPRDAANRSKVLASESLRGDGGIILDRHGRRFVNELAKRDLVSSEMLKHGGPFFIVINSRISRHLANYIDEYIEKGLMRHADSGADLAAIIGVSPDVIAAELEEYNAAATKKQDKFGKSHFRNVPFEMSDSYHVAFIEPVISYCVGGLLIDTHSRVIGKDGQPIRGLYAAGEVAGGVHGANPLAGNDLLDCVVFGRIAGVTAAIDAYGQDFVDRHMNPEVIKAQLRKAIEEQEKAIALSKRILTKTEKEIQESHSQITTEKAIVDQACVRVRALFGSFATELSELKFNTAGSSVDAMLGVESAKAVASAMRNKRKQMESEVDHLRAQIDEFQQNIETHAKEIAQLKKTGKQQTAEKKKLQSQLEEIRNSSTVIREIHELENQVATYKERQEKAERTKQDLESEWEAKLRQLETELVACRAKTEELEVMSRIEKVERKRQLEQVAQLVDRMKQKIGFEHTYAVKAAALAENQECPIFQLPLKRRLCPEIMGRSN